MPLRFGEQLKEIPGRRAAGMVTYRLDEILLPTLAGVLWGADDFAAMLLLSREPVTWLKQFLPDKHSVGKAQTFCKVFRLVKPEVLNELLALSGRRGKTLGAAWWRSSFDELSDCLVSQR
ncbi:MAG: transposase family protein [Candidatus Acidiferrum sp.]